MLAPLWFATLVGPYFTGPSMFVGDGGWLGGLALAAAIISVPLQYWIRHLANNWPSSYDACLRARVVIDEEDEGEGTSSSLEVETKREAPPGVAQTPGDDVTSLCAMGMPRLLLGLLASLPVPAGAGNSAKKKARGPSAAPDLDPATFLPFSSAFSGQEQNQDASASASGGGFEPSLKTSLCEGHAPYPSVRPWDGYRVDAMAPLANAMFGRPAVCEAVQKLGGVVGRRAWHGALSVSVTAPLSRFLHGGEAVAGARCAAGSMRA